MHLEYQELLAGRPGARGARSSACPGAIFSGRKRPAKGAARRVLLLRAPGARQGDWASSPRRPARPAGTSTTLDRDAILEEPGEIVASIRSKPDTPRSLHDRGDDARRDARQGREAHQEHLPEAGRRARRRQAGAPVLDGTERGLSRCRPITAPSSRAIKRFPSARRVPARRAGLADRRGRLRGV